MDTTRIPSSARPRALPRLARERTTPGTRARVEDSEGGIDLWMRVAEDKRTKDFSTRTKYFP